MQQIIVSFLIAFVAAILLGLFTIPLLRRLKFGQQVRDDGPKQHLSKQNTPTMGGLIIIVGLCVPVFLMSKNNWEFIVLSLLSVCGYGMIGFLDDFIKIRRKRSLGLKAYQKIIGQVGLAIVIAVWAYRNPMIGSSIVIPWANYEWDLGVFYIPFVIFFIVAVVNSVNLTDGLDGLATNLIFVNAATYAIIFMVLTATAQENGNVMLAANLKNMKIFAAGLAGACFGFLRYNTYPARIFMGDTGSLALGGALSIMAVVSRSILIIPITGLMFLLSAVSVILQVGSYKLRNQKRVFLMAPLHHHFELKGYPETKIVTMYTIITTLCCAVVLLGFAS